MRSAHECSYLQSHRNRIMRMRIVARARSLFPVPFHCLCFFKQCNTPARDRKYSACALRGVWRGRVGFFFPPLSFLRQRRAFLRRARRCMRIEAGKRRARASGRWGRRSPQFTLKAGGGDTVNSVSLPLLCRYSTLPQEETAGVAGGGG